MLDIGCGTLRGGRHFIRYLDPCHYYGIDISQKAIEAANALVNEEGLADKRPVLLVTERRDLKFLELDGRAFDCILAQSVFTHLPPGPIKECFAHIGTVRAPFGAFYFTYQRGIEFEQASLTGFRYPYSFFLELAERYDYLLEDRSADYPHPRGQRMIRMTRK